MTQPTPYERLDALERDVLQIARQAAELAAALTQQSMLLAALLNKLGESADILPGEKPLQSPSRTLRKGS